MADRRIDAMDVYISGYHVGVVSQKNGLDRFDYNPEWLNGKIRIPLSLSMPMTQREHKGQPVSAFLSGLLPDNEETRDAWSKRFHTSTNPFALLTKVGQDVAGAVQFVPLGDSLKSNEDDGHTYLTDDEIGDRLADLRRNAGTYRQIGDGGQFSLAGAQVKTAFHWDAEAGRWSIPLGSIPTTHIFKPPTDPRLDGHAENEHFCLGLAADLKMEAARSKVQEFGGQKSIVVERYDRRLVNGRTIRIHQEDSCQALGVLPSKKYQQEGGPGITDICTKVLSMSMDPVGDRHRFMAANIFNFIIAGPDAHGKNYSMLLGPNGTAKLAPLYDISSILPHLGSIERRKGGTLELREVELAMKIEKRYALVEIFPRHWERAASAARISPEWTIGELRRQLELIPDLASTRAAACRAEGLDHPVLDKLVDMISDRVVKLTRYYGAEAMTDSPAPAEPAI